MQGEADVLDVLWKRAIEDWDNPAAHDALIQMAFDRGELGRAAGLYRTQIEDEARAPLAHKKINAIALLATQGMEATKTDRSKATPRWVLWLAAAVCASAMAWLAYALSS